MSLQSRIAALLPVIKAYVDANAGGGAAPLLAGYRASTAMNVNASTSGVNIAWDDGSDRREDSGIAIDGAGVNVSVAGEPDRVRIEVNVKVSINDSSNVQRPNQVIELIRSDGRIIAASATGYIRDASDHEESSYNFVGTDFAPLDGGSYRVQARREGSNSGVVSLDTARSQMTVEVTP